MDIIIGLSLPLMPAADTTRLAVHVPLKGRQADGSYVLLQGRSEDGRHIALTGKET